MITGHASLESAIESVKQMQIIGYEYKPLDIDHLLAFIRQVVDRKRAEQDLEKHREHMENTVREKTADLNKRISEVEQLNSGMVNLLEDLRISNENLEFKTQQLAATNKELDAFSYSVSHDLRAPLRAIAGFSQMLVEDYGGKLDEEGQRKLDVIQVSAREMGKLIDDLLAFARMGRKSLKISRFKISSLVEEVIKKFPLVEINKNVKLKLENIPSVLGDRAMIHEVLVNLLENAIKYSRPGEEPIIEVSAKTEGDQHIYSVKDNGVGFDMQYAEKLFQVFQRLHSAQEFEGTGIGLALVQQIIHRHGGSVWAEGKVNEGATFYFALPIRASDQ